MLTIHIMRGLPGSGKSHIANQIDAQIVSADDYFYAGGIYHFDGRFLSAAHLRCQFHAYNLVKSGISIVVDNCNITRKDYEYYLDLSKEFGTQVEVHIPTTPWAWDVSACAQRNIHGVGFNSIQRMYKKWEI